MLRLNILYNVYHACQIFKLLRYELKIWIYYYNWKFNLFIFISFLFLYTIFLLLNSISGIKSRAQNVKKGMRLCD